MYKMLMTRCKKLNSSETGRPILLKFWMHFMYLGYLALFFLFPGTNLYGKTDYL